MGRVVLAAKVTHVPSLLLSEREGALKGRRQSAINSLNEIGRRARDRGADTFLIFDTHWLSNFGFHINANERHAGNYTSHEAPHLIQDLAYDYPGNPVLADLIVEEAADEALEVNAHRVRSLALEYGSIVPMRYMNADGGLKVLPVASPLFASIEENRKFGEACRRAISDRTPALLSWPAARCLTDCKQPAGWRGTVGYRLQRVQSANGSSRARTVGRAGATGSLSASCLNTPPSAAAKL